MISKVRFWHRFKKLIFGSFAILFGGLTCCLLGSWTVNPEGNIVGENLLDNEHNYVLKTISPNTNTTMLTTSLSVGDYYFSVYSSFSSIDGYFYLVNRNTSQVYFYTTLKSKNSFRITNNTDVLDLIFHSTTFSGSNVPFYLMLSSTDSYSSWEPYGAYYSQRNYDLARTNESTSFYQVFNHTYSYIFDPSSIYYGANGRIADLYNGYLNNNRNLPHEYILSNTQTYLNFYDYQSSSEYDYLTRNPHGVVLFVPVSPISSNLFFNLDDITFNYNLQALYLDGSVIEVSTENLYPHLYLATLPSSVENPIIAFSYDYYYEDYILANMKLALDSSGIDFNSIYKSGYEDAKSLYYSNYNYIKNDYEVLKVKFDDLQSQYNSLYETYSQSQGIEFNFTKLIWTIASTPFESFRSIWNVDFLGFNITAFVTGMFSIFIIVWLFKKVFK